MHIDCDAMKAIIRLLVFAFQGKASLWYSKVNAPTVCLKPSRVGQLFLQADGLETEDCTHGLFFFLTLQLFTSKVLKADWLVKMIIR